MKIKDLLESTDSEYILQKLADADINAAFKNGKIVVDKADVANAKKVLKKINSPLQVVGGLNEAQ